MSSEITSFDFVKLDFAKLEARVVAYCKEECVDLHLKRAADHYMIPIEEVTPQQRQCAKALNYIEMYSYSGRIKCLPETNRPRVS